MNEVGRGRQRRAMTSAWVGVWWAFRERLGEGISGLVSEERDVRQRGMKNSEMGTQRYFAGGGQRGWGGW